MAVTCGGSSTNYLTTTSSLVDFDGDLSIAFIIRTTDATSASADATWYLNKWILDKDQAGAGNAGWAVVFGGGKVKLIIRDDVLTQTTAINDGADHAIVCTRVASSGLCKIFLDGSDDTGGGATKTTSAINNTKDLNVGGVSGASGADATYARVGIWNGILTDSDIAAYSKRLPAQLIRPDVLKFMGEFVRDFTDLFGPPLTATGTVTVATHPRVIMPRRRPIGFAGTSPPPPPPSTYVGARYQMIGSGIQQFSGGRAA